MNKNAKSVKNNLEERLRQMKFSGKLSKKILSAIGISLAGSFVVFCLILTVVPHSSENVMDVTESTVRLRIC